MKFAELHLEQSLLSAIEKLGYQETTPIQSAVIPHVIDAKDISGLAPTGTGKTAAFLIPLMDRILKGRVVVDSLSDEQKALVQKRAFADWRTQNFILILVPTRELAEQVQENAKKLSEFSGLRSVAVYGGTGYDKQKEAFKNQVEFVVATPGRLIDLYKENFVDLKQVRAVVFDEADRMFDMGFKDDMKYILSRIPRERQFLVFSATMNFDVLNTAYQFGAEPVEINVSGDKPKAENVKDEIFHVGDSEKPMYLLTLLKKHNPKQAIIFSNFKFNVDRLARFLSDNGIPAMGISSLLTQAQRNRVIEQFKADNEKNILVATDVAARGLDIKGVDLVINYELPQDAESYVHRIGRTGRAGAMGQAFSLSSEKDVESLARIEEYLKNKLPIGWLEESDLVKDFKASGSDSSSRDRFSGEKKDFRRPRNDRGDKPRFERGDRGGERPRRQDRPERSDSRGEGRSEYRGENRNENRGEKRPQRSHKDFNRHDKGPQKQSSRDPKAPNASNEKSNQNFKRHPRKPFDKNKPHHKKSPTQKQPATVAAKVTGFFKKLFGGGATQSKKS